MKKILIMSVLVLVASLVVAGADSRTTAINDSVSGTIVTNASTAIYTGYLEGIYIDIDTTAAVTQTIVIATATETLLTATVSADTMYRPRYTANDNAGTVQNVSSNDLVKALLVGEQLTFTVTTASTNEADVLITVKTY